MTDRTIILAENGRASYRGLTREGEALWANYQRETDDLTYVIDYSNWLGSDTISSMTRTAYGTTVAGTSNTTTTSTQRLKGSGFVDIKATLTSGQVRTDRIVIRDRSENLITGTQYGI